jgi:hypothetical protein
VCVAHYAACVKQHDYRRSTKAGVPTPKGQGVCLLCLRSCYRIRIQSSTSTARVCGLLLVEHSRVCLLSCMVAACVFPRTPSLNPQCLVPFMLPCLALQSLPPPPRLSLMALTGSSATLCPTVSVARWVPCSCGVSGPAHPVRAQQGLTHPHSSLNPSWMTQPLSRSLRVSGIGEVLRVHVSQPSSAQRPFLSMHVHPC